MGLDHDAVAGPVATDPLTPTPSLESSVPQAVGEAIPVRGRWMLGATAEMREWALFGGARAVPAGAVARDGSLPKFRCSDVLMSRPTGTHIGTSTL